MGEQTPVIVPVYLTEPELRAVLFYLPLDASEGLPEGAAFRKLADALKRVARDNDQLLGRRVRPSPSPGAMRDLSAAIGMLNEQTERFRRGE